MTEDFKLLNKILSSCIAFDLISISPDEKKDNTILIDKDIRKKEDFNINFDDFVNNVLIFLSEHSFCVHDIKTIENFFNTIESYKKKNIFEEFSYIINVWENELSCIKLDDFHSISDVNEKFGDKIKYYILIGRREITKDDVDRFNKFYNKNWSVKNFNKEVNMYLDGSIDINNMWGLAGQRFRIYKDGNIVITGMS